MSSPTCPTLALCVLFDALHVLFPSCFVHLALMCCVSSSFSSVPVCEMYQTDARAEVLRCVNLALRFAVLYFLRSASSCVP